MDHRANEIGCVRLSPSHVAFMFGLCLCAAQALFAAPESEDDDNGGGNGSNQIEVGLYNLKGGARFATYNASLNRNTAGQLIQDLSTPDNAQARAVAEVIQRIDPDVLLINEFDFDEAGQALALYQQNYLSISQNNATPISFLYTYSAPSNTGVPSGFDLDNNGSVGGGNDAFGFGLFPRQFAFVVLSKFPIVLDEARTFQLFLWKDMPGALLPDDPNTPAPNDFYSPEELDVFRLSSKSHWDVPINVNGQIIHLLTSHPTPPVFDGPEDRNGKRNHDEIRFWKDYLKPNSSRYIYDDSGEYGGLSHGAKFVILGDMNADPLDGDSVAGAIQQLLNHPKINDSHIPASLGAPEQAQLQGGANAAHESNPHFDTADFVDTPGPGNLRVDYVLPSKNLKLNTTGVFWPQTTDPLFDLIGVFPFRRRTTSRCGSILHCPARRCPAALGSAMSPPTRPCCGRTRPTQAS